MVYIGLNPIEITSYEYVRPLMNCPRRRIWPREVNELLFQDHHSCCNMNHIPVLELVERRTGIHVDIDETNRPPRYELRKGDRIILIEVGHIRQLVPGEKYNREEIRKAVIVFWLYTVTKRLMP